VIDRVNKWPLVLSYLGTSFSLFTLVGFADPARVAEMFRPPFVQAALFCACFMLTDPPTSPGRYAEQVAIGLLVGAATCAAQLLGAGQAYLLLGLLVGNAVLAGRRWMIDVRRAKWRDAASPRQGSRPVVAPPELRGGSALDCANAAARR
jgi:Na+-translocating ferredoxin:NAD+ oxidoreductase RnfD subunit